MLIQIGYPSIFAACIDFHHFSPLALGMFKRARVCSHGDGDGTETLVTESQKQFGSQLREFLLDKYCLEGLAGADVASICFLATQAGACGVADLALDPSLAAKHGNEHVKLHAGKIWPDLDLQYVDCPVYVKRESRRSTVQIPVYLPSTALDHYVTEDMLDVKSNKNKDSFDYAVAGVDNYDAHPIVCKARAEGFEHVVRPVALYWDGVAYTNHDSFMGFYVTDILSSQKFLSFLIRIFAKNYPNFWWVFYP